MRNDAKAQNTAVGTKHSCIRGKGRRHKGRFLFKLAMDFWLSFLIVGPIELIFDMMVQMCANLTLFPRGWGVSDTPPNRNEYCVLT